MGTGAAAAPLVVIDRASAYELYVAAGRSYVRLHEQTRIPLGTLKSWGAADQWADRADRDERLRRRLIRRQTDAAILGGLPATLAAIDALIADTEDAFDVVGGATVCTHRSTPPSVRAKLLVWKAGLAGLVPGARAVDADDDAAEESAVDPSTLSDEDLIALLKRGGRR